MPLEVAVAVRVEPSGSTTTEASNVHDVFIVQPRKLLRMVHFWLAWQETFLTLTISIISTISVPHTGVPDTSRVPQLSSYTSMSLARLKSWSLGIHVSASSI